MKPYLIVSDIHFHDFSAFSEILPSGVNSRLQTSLNEIKRAADTLKKVGGNTIYFTGDIFHVRGSISPKVLNPVRDFFENVLSKKGFTVRMIPGNHDLADKESNTLGSMIQALEGFGVEINNNKNGNYYSDDRVLMIPWHSTVEGLKETMQASMLALSASGAMASTSLSEVDLMIHAPIDDVIYGLPEHGLTADYLGSLGFKRVFAGHYHNHKDFGNGVYSVGALTHISFSDVGSKAGFLIVSDKGVSYSSTHAPKFVDIDEDNFSDLPLLVDGNFVRCKIKISKESEVEKLRAHIMANGAAGVVISQIKDTTTVRPTEGTGAIGGSLTLEQSVAAHVKEKGYSQDVAKLCMEILSEAES
jgi:DNA repair exonuclease SbcCD nuclease subunit